MKVRQPLAAALSLLVMLALVAPLAANWSPQTAAATGSQLVYSQSASPLPIPPIAQAIWDAADGPVARLEIARGWLLGPAPLAMTVEHDDDSPTGTRELVYFDKGRLDILDANAKAGDEWAVPGGQLVTELLAGAIQLDVDRWVTLTPAEIPLVGDPDQLDAITYMTLGRLATLPGDLGADVAPRPTAQIGERVMAVLRSDGSIVETGYARDVMVSDFDSVTGHNVAEPFQAWGESQAFERLYVLGHPLTEPYWVETTVGGIEQHVLIQAFERRILSYTPGNAAEWQVESGNVGQHYRAWRGLTQSADPALAPLVASVPFGEEIVAAAETAGVDPYLLAAVAEVSSGGDPFHVSSEGRRGLLGVDAELAPASYAPAANATAGARELVGLLEESGDEHAALAAYHGATGASATSFADDVLTTRDGLRARQAAPAAVGTITQPLAHVASGTAAAFPASYDGAWWARYLAWAGSSGSAVSGWSSDPLGYYCVAPGYAAGDRLRLVANGNSIDCTIGGEAGDPGLPGIGDGVVTLNDAAFEALELHGRNDVRIFHLGPAGGQRTASAGQINAGAAAFYAAGYDVGWWEQTMLAYSGWGGAVAGWSVDPNGFYCVHPGYKVGQRLRLVANGVTLDCTIGDTVQQQHLAQWQSRWAIEMSWDTFAALGLAGNNSVEVFAVE